MYRNAYNLVLHKHGELLYDGVRSCASTHLERIGDEVARTTDEQLLASLRGCWERHRVTMVMIQDILMYMDRTYVTQNRRLPVYQMGLQIFLDSVARHPRVRSRVQGLLLGHIQAEREGHLIDHGLIRTILSMLADL